MRLFCMQKIPVNFLKHRGDDELNDGVKRVGFTPVPHLLMRDWLPYLRTRHHGANARDALFLFLYLCAYTNGNPAHNFYMWAFPSNTQICSDTGIHKDRLTGLVDVLVSEGLLITKRVPYNGHTKRLYMPLMPDIIPDTISP